VTTSNVAIFPSYNFATDIEKLVADKGMGYLEAIMHWCTTRGLDEHAGAELVKRSGRIKSRLQDEAAELRLVQPRKKRGT